MRPRTEIGGRLLRLVARLDVRVRAEFEHDPGIALWQHIDRRLGEIARLQAPDNHSIQAFDGDRTKALVVGDRISREVDIVESENQQDPVGRTIDEVYARFEDKSTRSLCPNERTSQIEAVFRKKLVQIEAGYAPLDGRKPTSYQLSITISQFSEVAIDLSFAPSSADDLLNFLFGGRPDPEPHSIVGHDLKGSNVFKRLASHHRMRPARVVANHPPECAAAMGRRVRRERQTVALCRRTQRIADYTGLDDCRSRLRVEVQDATAGRREIEHHRIVDRLTAHRRSTAANQQRRAMIVADSNSLDEFIQRSRNHDADRDLSIVGGI